MRRCGWCDAELPFRTRLDARFCSTRCRVASHRAPLPRQMLAADRWIRRSRTKVPLTVEGTAASSTDPRTWSSYRAAQGSTVGVGLGFVLDGDGIVCIDIDHCMPGGRITRAAEAFLATLPSTFIEVSPSGDGLHVWGLGRVEHGRRTKHAGLWIEAYGTGRYLTVTGERFRNAPARLADLTSVLTPIL